jgi:hypothetical protein
MARKIKIPNEVAKRFAREESKRKEATKSIRKFYLIVCEGEKTEPNYFEKLGEDLPKGIITTKVFGTGYNTVSLVEEARKIQKEYEDKNPTKVVDKLWVVFDKDNFDPESFNRAIEKCNSENIGCAWSNEAFELWYLLHFGYYQNAMNRTEYQGKIEKQLGKKLGVEYKYKKNDEKMYSYIKDYTNTAINNAKRLNDIYKERKDFSNQNPCTQVWKLMEDLLEFKR